MPTEILMPALTPTMEEGTLAKWHVREGDEVRTGDVIAEIETDKATMEVEAIDDGWVGKILVAEGTEHEDVLGRGAAPPQEGDPDVRRGAGLDEGSADGVHLRPEALEGAADAHFKAGRASLGWFFLSRMQKRTKRADLLAEGERARLQLAGSPL